MRTNNSNKENKYLDDIFSGKIKTTDVDWARMSWYFCLSADFIRYFRQYVNWPFISITQELSEDFIWEHRKYVNWTDILKYQKLSESFIEKAKDFLMSVEFWKDVMKKYDDDPEEYLGENLPDGYLNIKRENNDFQFLEIEK